LLGKEWAVERKLAVERKMVNVTRNKEKQRHNNQLITSAVIVKQVTSLDSDFNTITATTNQTSNERRRT
jgi:hypothetical protein